MPSLSDLGKFRDSFGDIAHEKDELTSRSLPYESYTLPDTEPPPFEPNLRQDDQSDDIFSDDTGAGTFDINSLIGNITSGTDTPPPIIDDIDNIDDIFNDANTALGEDSSSDDNASSSDDASSPSIDDFLKNFNPVNSDETLNDNGEEINLATEDPGIKNTGIEDAGTKGFDNLNLNEEIDSGTSGDDSSGEMPIDDSFFNNLGNENAEEPIDTGFDSLDDIFNQGNDNSITPDKPNVDTNEPSVSGEGIDLGGESLDIENAGKIPTDDANPFDDANFQDLNIGEDSQGTEPPAEPSEDDPFSSFNDSSFDDSTFGEPSSMDDSSFGDSSSMDDSSFGESPIDDSSFGEPMTDQSSAFVDEERPPESTEGLESPGAGFDELGDGFSSENIDLNNDNQGQDDELLDDDNFVIPNLDEMFDKKKLGIPDAPKKKSGFPFLRRKKSVSEEIIDHDADLDKEIKLSQDDIDKLTKTLSGYPLNLRIACEELIAEKVLQPQQLSKIIRLLIHNAPPKETAEFAGPILGREITIPKSFEKSSGEALEAEKASFAYIFMHNFLPVLRLFAFIAAIAGSVFYLGYRFIYIPLKAESLYKRGYERIAPGENQRAEELFHEAFSMHHKKDWFYKYAEGFRDNRHYMLAENKYDELLRYYIRDHKGILDYANLETYYLLNYEKANRILQQQLLDYSPDDYDGLLAAGDNFFAWADSDPSRFYDKYEDARFSWGRILDKYGWQPPVVGRMIMFFIRTDNLKEVLYLKNWFDGIKGRNLSTEALAEVGGYLLDKQLDKTKGVKDPYLESIEGVRDLLLKAVKEDVMLPEPHYHLARYYNNLGNVHEERLTLENAIRAFDLAKTESVRRRLFRVDTHYRYANLLINNREFFPAEEQAAKGIDLYTDFMSRNLISPSPKLGQLYAIKGDLEYFVKTGDMEAALVEYHNAEQYGWSPPEVQYRMGSAYYQQENWGKALDYLFKASADLPLNRRLLYALGNTAYKRGDYYAAQGYYNRLLDILENGRLRFPVLLPNDRPEFLELGERLMMARNNAGVVYETLANQTGSRDYRSRALSLYAESARAWDTITRNPETMVRLHLFETPAGPGVNLGYLNAGNAMRSGLLYEPEIFIRIDKDVLEPSHWEELAPFGGLVVR